MLFNKYLLSTLVLLAVFQFPLVAYSENKTADFILREADLPKLIGTDQAVNLAAQPVNPKGSSKNVNTFNNFIAIGVVSGPNVQTNLTSFNEEQVVLKKVTHDGPWIGVANYFQKEIPKVSLQEGLIAVQACMKKSGTPAPSHEVTHVTIYKTLNTSQFIYAYSFKIPGKSTCQEILYSPTIQECEMGMQVACHINIGTMKK